MGLAALLCQVFTVRLQGFSSQLRLYCSMDWFIICRQFFSIQFIALQKRFRGIRNTLMLSDPFDYVLLILRFSSPFYFTCEEMKGPLGLPFGLISCSDLKRVLKLTFRDLRPRFLPLLCWFCVFARMVHLCLWYTFRLLRHLFQWPITVAGFPIRSFA